MSPCWFPVMPGVSVSACSSACLPACLPACLSVSHTQPRTCARLHTHTDHVPQLVHAQSVGVQTSVSLQVVLLNHLQVGLPDDASDKETETELTIRTYSSECSVAVLEDSEKGVHFLE